ncbi:uncharacterized protein LOC108483914 [Gossypium arboreum]|uniref:XS domain-containing protein n=1 Tax=Gossypium arboreum TaxID=29729 RepID=A0ABR0PB61_GOSAR|nr:uncharacterized protein LOC108483914 [Gossypium arboreum]KAK5818458.1 hypothetical protein PVK06_023395 [Gossypium arboreum]
MSSTRSGSRYPYPRSRHRDLLSGSKRLEPERSSLPKKQLQYARSNHEDDNESELCMKKLSEFNESLRRQHQSTSTKFQWNRLLSDYPGKEAAAAASKPEPTMPNDGTSSPYSMSPMGIDLTEENRFVGSRPLHLKEVKSGFINNGERFGYPDIGKEGMIGGTVGFDGFGEKLGFDSSSVIFQKAMSRIRRTEEVTESAYRKMESVRARASAIDSIVDKINGSGKSGAMDMEPRISLPQQYMTEKKREVLHGEMLPRREDCSNHALTQHYVGFSGEGERVVGLEMNHFCSPKGALFHGERRLFPQLSPDVKEKADRNLEREIEVVGSCFNGCKSQNGEVFLSETQQVQRYAYFSRESHDEMKQYNEDFGSRMKCHPSPKRVPFHAEGHSLAQTFVRESHVTEQTNDVFSSRTTRPKGQKMALSEVERPELSADHTLALPQRYLDFNVEPDDKQQANELLGSRMSHHPKLNVTPSHGEELQIQDDFSHSLPRHHFGLNGESPVMEQETEVLGSRMCYPQDDKEAYFRGEMQQLQQDCAMEVYPFPNDDDFSTNEGSTPHISATEEVCINSQSSMEHPKKRIIDLRKIRESWISTLTQTSDASDDEILDIGYQGQRYSDEDSSLPRNSPQMLEFTQLTNRKSVKQRLGGPCRVNYPSPPHRKSIKQRLGPSCQVHHNRTSVKQRLWPSYQVHSSISIPRIERHKPSKLAKEKVNEFCKRVQARGVVSHPVKRGRTIPPEDSDEFEQLIHRAYFKFVKVLNENPAQRRKYTNKGEVETIKCFVCGSKSEDFVNTLSLAMHAFASQKVGCRVEHMGLHKALCLLMGWDSVAVSKGIWAPKTLPDAEAVAMKEDLVVWPPVVILHNGSIGTTNSGDRIVVSIEELEAFLREAGFGRGISKVCHGKPVNQSIMVVIFHGTFSGLQEAERLHKLYAENKHGRAEFQRVNCNSGETQHKLEDVLYGYLGIAGDLDKLDIKTKSHSIVKSKKGIYAIADAHLDTE